MLSIIIPTLNEEKYLPLLLNSIKRQNPSKNYEVIVADAGSADKTIEIAKSFGCKVVKGGLPARGRNEGARVSKGELFLFLDADLKLPNNFLEKSLKEFGNRKLDIASYCLEPQTNKKIIKTGFALLYNWPITFYQKILAHGSGGILVKKEIFKKVKGFDEDIKLAEDHYFVRQASRVGKFGIIKSTRICMFLRRFEADGYLKTCLKYLLCQLYMFLGKGVKSNVFKYKFGHYSPSPRRGEDKEENKVLFALKKKKNKL